MSKSFADILAVGGKSNSLGRANEVTEAVLQDKVLLEALYQCLFNDDAWTRMRAADSLEKVCRLHPDWLTPYVDRLMADFATNQQASIQWHMAQIYRQVALTPRQERLAMQWLKQLLGTTRVDWIVAANAMRTLAQFTQQGALSESELRQLVEVQLQHPSKSVVKRAQILLTELK